MGDEKKGFTVKDRRHFTSAGEVRGEEPEEAKAPLPDPRPALPPSSAGNVAEELDAVSYAAFLMSLGGQAGAMLESDDPADAAGARHIIAILEMLQEKTQGRLSVEEQRLHEGLLYELRMAYLERHRTAKA